MEKTNYVAVAMRCLNRRVATINATLKLLDIYIYIDNISPKFLFFINFSLVQLNNYNGYVCVISKFSFYDKLITNKVL